jgi:hypothetical protein
MQEVFAVQSTLANAFNSRVTDGVVRLGLNYNSIATTRSR